MTEKSHAELEKHHYQMVRKSAGYRAWFHADNLAAEMEPSNSSFYYQEPEPIKEMEPHSRHDQELRGLVLYLQNKLNEHLDKSKKRSPKDPF